jgi:hypothetical protein
MALRGGLPGSNSNIGVKGEAIGGRGGPQERLLERAASRHQGELNSHRFPAVLLQSLRRRPRQGPPVQIQIQIQIQIHIQIQIQIGSPQSKAPMPPARDVTAVSDSLGIPMPCRIWLLASSRREKTSPPLSQRLTAFVWRRFYWGCGAAGRGSGAVRGQILVGVCEPSDPGGWCICRSLLGGLLDIPGCRDLSRGAYLPDPGKSQPPNSRRPGRDRVAGVAGRSEAGTWL